MSSALYFIPYYSIQMYGFMTTGGGCLTTARAGYKKRGLYFSAGWVLIHFQGNGIGSTRTGTSAPRGMWCISGPSLMAIYLYTHTSHTKRRSDQREERTWNIKPTCSGFRYVYKIPQLRVKWLARPGGAASQARLFSNPIVALQPHTHITKQKVHTACYRA